MKYFDCQKNIETFLGERESAVVDGEGVITRQTVCPAGCDPRQCKFSEEAKRFAASFRAVILNEYPVDKFPRV